MNLLKEKIWICVDAFYNSQSENKDRDWGNSWIIQGKPKMVSLH